jgi:enoyl-CoA hydratase/carnithine racemase
MEPELLSQTCGQVAVLTLNRPGRLNAPPSPGADSASQGARQRGSRCN